MKLFSSFPYVAGFRVIETVRCASCCSNLRRQSRVVFRTSPACTCARTRRVHVRSFGLNGPCRYAVVKRDDNAAYIVGMWRRHRSQYYEKKMRIHESALREIDTLILKIIFY